MKKWQKIVLVLSTLCVLFSCIVVNCFAFDGWIGGSTDTGKLLVDSISLVTSAVTDNALLYQGVDFPSDILTISAYMPRDIRLSMGSMSFDEYCYTSPGGSSDNMLQFAHYVDIDNEDPDDLVIYDTIQAEELGSDVAEALDNAGLSYYGFSDFSATLNTWSYGSSESPGCRFVFPVNSHASDLVTQLYAELPCTVLVQYEDSAGAVWYSSQSSSIKLYFLLYEEYFYSNFNPITTVYDELNCYVVLPNGEEEFITSDTDTTLFDHLSSLLVTYEEDLLNYVPVSSISGAVYQNSVGSALGSANDVVFTSTNSWCQFPEGNGIPLDIQIVQPIYTYDYPLSVVQGGKGNIELEVVDVKPFDWLAGAIQNVFDLNVWGDLTLGHIIMVALAVPALLAILRAIAGG